MMFVVLISCFKHFLSNYGVNECKLKAVWKVGKSQNVIIKSCLLPVVLQSRPGSASGV